MNGYHVVADQAFVGINNVKIPVRRTLNGGNSSYYYELSKQRILVENCFGRLKGKFKKLFYSNKNGETEKYQKVVAGACIIHNLIIEFE